MRLEREPTAGRTSQTFPEANVHTNITMREQSGFTYDMAATEQAGTPRQGAAADARQEPDRSPATKAPLPGRARP